MHVQLPILHIRVINIFILELLVLHAVQDTSGSKLLLRQLLPQLLELDNVLHAVHPSLIVMPVPGPMLVHHVPLDIT